MDTNQYKNYSELEETPQEVFDKYKIWYKAMEFEQEAFSERDAKHLCFNKLIDLCLKEYPHLFQFDIYNHVDEENGKKMIRCIGKILIPWNEVKEEGEK